MRNRTLLLLSLFFIALAYYGGMRFDRYLESRKMLERRQQLDEQERVIEGLALKCRAMWPLRGENYTACLDVTEKMARRDM